MSGQIIVLNGAGSVGKSSTARAFQKLVNEHYLHVQGDAFLRMIAPQLWDNPEGVMLVSNRVDDEATVEIVLGPVFHKVMIGMRTAVGTLAQAGNNCIVDDILQSPADQQTYIEAKGCETIRFVGLHAPLSVLERREHDRGDRLSGLARWQFDRVHNGIAYDLEIDTNVRSPIECAREIAEKFNINIVK